jgi:hypothetical protein
MKDATAPLLFLVECYMPEASLQGVETAADRLFAAASTAVRYAGCIAIPDDDCCLFLFHSTEQRELESLFLAAGVSYDRIVKAIQVTARSSDDRA